MILVNDLGDGFPTFPQFVQMLTDYEATHPLQETEPVEVARHIKRSASWVEPPGLSVWDDGQTRCVHGVEVFRVCRKCRTYLQTVQRYCDTESTE